MTSQAERLLVIGLDGATFDLILPWVEAGKLPTFQHLLQTGAAAPLRSVVHPYTAQAWTTMVTGYNAGEHRIFDFWERDFATYGFKLLNASMRTKPAIWNYLSQRDIPVIVVNVPMSYPPEAVNGVMISGRDTPGLDSDYTYPSSFKHELKQKLARDYVIVPDDWLYAQRNDFAKVRDALLDEIDVRIDTVQYLMQDRDWKFCMFVISATDGAMHFLWRFHDETYPLFDPELATALANPLLQIYRHIDNRLAELLEKLLDDTKIVLVSDHGGGSNPIDAIHLNLWLAQQNLLSFRSVTGKKAGNALIAKSIEALKKRVYRTISFQNLTKIRRHWPNYFRSRLSSTTLFSDIDWSQTKAFSEERRGNIWINLKGRDPQGVVEQGAEYEAIRTHIVEELPKLTNPRIGEKAIKRVWRREELFEGPYSEKLPDLIIEAENPDIFRSRGSYSGSAPMRQLEPTEILTAKTSGCHRYNGIFMATGKGIQSGVWLDEINMIDVAPTLLYMLNEPVPIEMEGQVIEHLFEEEHLHAQPPKRNYPGDSPRDKDDSGDQNYSEDEARAVEERLAALGYLD